VGKEEEEEEGREGEIEREGKGEEPVGLDDGVV